MPDTPQLHYTYNTLEEAEVWARSLGVLVDYDGRLDLANYANELLWRLNTRALPLPDEIRIDAGSFHSLGRHAIVIPASTNKRRISINPSALYWNDPVSAAYEARQQRFWSSDDPLHPLLHEAGHALIYKASPESWEGMRDLTNAQKTVAAGEVSVRACQDAYEFSAEVFAALMAGQKYGENIMRWYKSRGGIRVW